MVRRHPVGILAVLVAMAVIGANAFGTGLVHRKVPPLDGGVWLGSANGSLAHVDGSSAQVDWRLSTGKGTFQVTQDGTGALVETADGHVTAIDPTAMALVNPTDLADPHTQVVTGGGRTYVVYLDTGISQQVSADTLDPVGDAVDLGGTVTSAAVDAGGELYVRLDDGSTTESIDGDHQRAETAVDGSDATSLTAVGGTVVAVDTGSGVATVLHPDGGTRSIGLGVSGKGIAVPPGSSGPDLWLTDGPDAQLLSVDLTNGEVGDTTIAHAGNGLSAPQATGSFTYLYDRKAGAFLTVDEQGQVTTTKAFAPGTDVQLLAKDGLVYANDFGGPHALVADRHGVVKQFDKYTAPAATSKAKAKAKTLKPKVKKKAKPKKKRKPPKHKPKKVKHKKPPAPAPPSTTTTTRPGSTTTTTTTPPPSSTTTTTTAPDCSTTTTTSTDPTSTDPTTTTTTTDPASSTTTTTGPPDCPTTTSTSTSTSTNGNGTGTPGGP